MYGKPQPAISPLKRELYRGRDFFLRTSLINLSMGPNEMAGRCEAENFSRLLNLGWPGYLSDERVRFSSVFPPAILGE
jgi:hypothetical protein